MAIRFDECLLHRIFCVFHLAQHGPCHAKHASFVTSYQRLKSLTVTAEDALNQAQILVGRVRLPLVSGFRHLQRMGSVPAEKGCRKSQGTYTHPELSF